MKDKIIAARYADALFEELKSDSNRKKAISELALIVDLISSSTDFYRMIYSPLVSSSEKISVFQSIFVKKKFNGQLLNFIKILVNNSRLDLLSEISSYLQLNMIESKGQLAVDAVFATKPTPALKTAVIKKLESLTKKRVLLNEKIDPSMIAGVRIQYGSILYDATVKAALDELRDNMI